METGAGRWPGGCFSELLTRYSDLVIAFAMLAAIGVILLPLPTALISLLLIVNLAMCLTVLFVSLYVSTPLQLASFPSVLLLTTLFRFCLSIAVTRAVLRHGEAGGVVATLGHLTGGGNLVVGAVVFLIILVVQFIVVTKGAERVAEVAARFTLDALPGKQMAIDADLRAGLVTQAEAKRARADLQKESRLYGAMDGAMKFVKGDSIATVVITAINICAGFAIGLLYNDLSPAQAARKYTILTIGDGLAAILPSVVIAVSAGLVVTRVAGDEEKTNVGADIGRQILVHPKPLAFTAALVITLIFLPGMPALPPLFVGAALGGLALSAGRAQRRKRAEAEREAEASGAGADDELQPSHAVPLAVVVSQQLTHLIAPDSATGARFRASLPRLRASLYYDLGVMLPNVYVSGDAPLQTHQYFIAIKEVPVVYGDLKPDCVYVNDTAERIKAFGLDGENSRNPADQMPGAWIPAAQREAAERAGLKVWEPLEVVALHLSDVMRQCAHEFVGIQEAQACLDFAARAAPKLVEEVIGKVMSIHGFAEVLRRLVQEGVSIRDVKSVLDALAEWGRVEKDPALLTEHVRSALRRNLSFRHTAGRDALFVHLLDPEIEDVIRSAVRQTSSGSFLALDPATAHDILTALRREVSRIPPTGQKPVIITDMELRRFVRKMVELEFPQLSVLSYQELPPELNIQPVARISLRHPPPIAPHNLPLLANA
jgi:type III secretion protein V